MPWGRLLEGNGSSASQATRPGKAGYLGRLHCNGAYVGGRYWFRRRNPEGREVEAGVHHIGGFRNESFFSLPWNWICYRGRIPDALIWIHDDPFGNAICLGIAAKHRGLVYFWDHENEPAEDWDGAVETAGNVTLIANSFTEYVSGLQALDDDRVLDVGAANHDGSESAKPDLQSMFKKPGGDTAEP